MAKPVDLTIRVKADTGEVAPGMQKLDKQLDQATKSAAKLDAELVDISKRDVELDVNTQAIKTARDRIDDLRDDIARMKAVDIDADTRKAEQDIAKLKRSIKALSDDTKPIKLGGDDVGRDLDDGLARASEGVDEFGRESESTAKEVAASFDGSAESIAGAFQEVAANAFAGFGPAGLVAGLGIAAGIGLGIQALTKVAEEANEAKQEVVDLAAEIREAGGEVTGLDWSARFQEFGDTIVDTKSWFELWQTSSTTALEKAADVAEKTGASFEDVFQGMAGDVPAAQRAIDDLNDGIAAQQKVVDKLKTSGVAYNSDLGQRNQKQREALAELKGYRTELEKAIGTTNDAIERNELFARAMGMTVEEYQAQLVASEAATAAQEEAAAAAKASAEAYEQLVADLADPTTVYEQLLTDQTEAEKLRAQAVADGTKSSEDSWEDYAEGVAVSTEELIAEWNRQAEQARAFEINLGIIAAAGGQKLADELRAKGPAVAGAVADLVANSDPAERQDVIEAHENAAAAGASVGQGYADGIASKQDEVDRAIAAIWRSLLKEPPPGPWRTGYVPSSPSGLSASGTAVVPGAAAVPGNVRVYIDGNQLRATVRTDVAAASARAALVGTGARSRP